MTNSRRPAGSFPAGRCHFPPQVCFAMATPRRRVLLVGWDAADWKVIHPLLDAGKLPALARLVAAGAIGECVSVTPSIAPLAWTTVATGLRSNRHGILSEREPDPVSGDWRPTSCRGRTAKALWNIATQNGLRSIVVNQAASHPAEPIFGVCVDERITSVAVPLGVDWPLPEGCIHPAETGATASMSSRLRRFSPPSTIAASGERPPSRPPATGQGAASCAPREFTWCRGSAHREGHGSLRRASKPWRHARGLPRE